MSWNAAVFLRKGLAEIEGIHIWGKPDLWAIAFGSEKYDILAVCYKMWEKGWMTAPNSQPPGIHFMITPVHEPFIQDYLKALKKSVSEVSGEKGPKERADVRYS